MSAPVVDILLGAIGAVAELVKIGLIREDQRREAEHAAIVGMRAVGPDLAARYRAVLEERERSDADEIELRRAIAARLKTPPDTLRVVDPHDHDDGEG